MKRKVKVGSRGSVLALAQVEEISRALRLKRIHVDFDCRIYDTSGDIDKKTPLIEDLPDDFFTDSLDRALLNMEIDVAIHSAKDLPKRIPKDLRLLALTKALDETDSYVGRLTLKSLPKGAKVGTSSPVRQEMVKVINPKVKTASIRGNIFERLQKIDEGAYDGIIVATAALKRLGLASHIKEIMPWETTALQGQLAVVGRVNDKKMSVLFRPIDVRKNYGSVTLVGAGPGDHELITLKGINALKKADCVLYDFLVPKKLLGFALKAKHVYVGKRKGKHTLPQSRLNKKLRDIAFTGKRIVRLKGGDPLIFGRGADEIEYLRSFYIEVHVIPGLSSTTAIPSTLEIPLTARDKSSSVAFISGHGKGESKSKPRPINIPNCETIVFLMGLTKLDLIVKSLLKKGWSKATPMIIVSKGTCRDEKRVLGTLGDIQKKVKKVKLKTPALIVAGETVSFYQEGS